MTGAQDLCRALGGEWRGHGGNAPCPVCQPERRPDQRGLSIRSEAGQLLAFCHKTGCDFRDIVKAAGLPPDALRHDPEEARKADAQREAYAAEQRAKARKLWASSAPICGTRGEADLRGRGITCPLPPSLRWAADTFHGPSGRWLAAMVLTTSAASSESGRPKATWPRLLPHETAGLKSWGSGSATGRTSPPSALGRGPTTSRG